MTDPTPTPGAPVPPDELRSIWINDSAILSPGATGGPMLRIGTDWKIVVSKAAAWGYAQAMQEREELISLCGELLQCLEYLDRAYDVPVPPTLLDRAAERLGGGGSDG